MGFDVVTAINGLQALNSAAEHRPDVLVIDVHLPEVDGLSVLAYLSEAAKSVPHVIVMTGRAGGQVIELCSGFDAFCIPKGLSSGSSSKPALPASTPRWPLQYGDPPGYLQRPNVRKRPRVLLEDDDISVKRMFFHKFDRLGADLLCAADAAQGFWKAQREQPAVIVADFCMPRGDTKYLLTKLRKYSRDQHDLGDCTDRTAPQQSGQTPTAGGYRRPAGSGKDIDEVVR
jgi:CheY-like chemotaxis protein